MENFLRAMVVLAHCATVSNALAADFDQSSQRQALLGLEEFHKSIGDLDGHCSLGLLGAGDPFVITRVSDWFQDNGIIESDQLLEVNGIDIRGHEDLQKTLSKLKLNDSVTLRLSRDDELFQVSATCRDGTPYYRAREEALMRASEGHWDECIRATYLEEVYWGGANSQSAALRLWCHQARTPSGAVDLTEESAAHNFSRLDAYFIYEYANHLLDEYQHVPGGIDAMRITLYDSIRQLDDAGYLLLSNELSLKLAELDRKLVASR